MVAGATGIVGTGIAIAAANSRPYYYDSYGYGPPVTYYGGGPAYYGGGPYPSYYGGYHRGYENGGINTGQYW